MLATNIVLILLFLFWRPLAGQVWQIVRPFFILIAQVVFALGWFLVLVSTFLTNHFEEASLRIEIGETYGDYQRRTKRLLPFY